MGTPQRMSGQMPSPANTPKNYISPILDHSGSRKRQDIDCDYNLESKRRKAEKVGKGLRHFSMKVCEKVKRKGTTSYNEVADELVAEFSSCSTMPLSTADQYDQKNIRRRVYDALNVLMAMNIISKEKKEIKWLGLPANSLQECHTLEKEKQQRMEQIRTKTQQLNDLIIQQIAFKNLVQRNADAELKRGRAPEPSSCIQLPFLVVNTDKKTVIDCSISKDKTEYLFNFDNTFEVNDDIVVLKRMGMDLGLAQGTISMEDLENVKTMVPKSLEKYVYNLAAGNPEPEICVKMEREVTLSSVSVSSMDVLCEEDTSSEHAIIADPSENYIVPEVGSPTTSCEFSDNDSEYSEDVEVN